MSASSLTRAAATLACGILALLPIAARADVSGRVLSESDHPVAGARVGWLSAPDAPPTAEVLTDPRGRFRLAGVDPPGSLDVTHPFFVSRRLDIEVADGDVVVRLEPRPELFEEVEVAGRRGGDRRAPVGVSSAVVRPADSIAPPSGLSELVVGIPGVSENGQGGLFQVVSIRGVSRQRIQTQVAGMRITSERRAGVSASFLDPLLMESADVLRGPASSYYGSGALGGVLQVFPRRFTSTFASAGRDSQGDENVLVIGSGNERWSAGLAHRDASDAEDPDGNVLSSAFTQTSAVVRGAWGDGPRLYSFTWVGALGDDIGKPSSAAPDRITTYPRETHNLVSFGIEGDAGWTLEAAVHPHNLETDVFEAGVSRSTVKNDTVDFSGRFERVFRTAAADGAGTATASTRTVPPDDDHSGSNLVARLGIDLFGRRNVNADEVRLMLDPNSPVPVESFASLDDARAIEVGVFGTLSGSWGRTGWEAGGRVIWLTQRNAGRPTLDDGGASGFFGIATPLSAHVAFEANLGSGLRFPSLTERFFTGTTGRGRVTGNPDLDPERSLNADVGLRWLTGSWLVSASIFRNVIDDYIERVETAPGELTFVNRTDGTIEGVELQGAWRLSSRWRITFGGHALDGEIDGGGNLADIPPAEVYGGVRWQRDRLTLSGRWTWRDDKRDPGSGEQAIDAARIVSAAAVVDVADGWRVAVTATNLLDETYLPSADDRALAAPGRSLGVRLSWTGGR